MTTQLINHSNCQPRRRLSNLWHKAGP